MLEKGYIQVYTGNGKGKTTAALGLILRASCAGHRVFLGQFLKGRETSELRAARLLPGLDIEQFGDAAFIRGKPSEEDFARAEAGLERAGEALLSEAYDVVVLDELNTALSLGLLPVKKVLDLIALKPEKTELILTGRSAPQEITERADLVTEMKEIKHYYKAGVGAREGIEK